jgi:hypothetical protein
LLLLLLGQLLLEVAVAVRSGRRSSDGRSNVEKALGAALTRHLTRLDVPILTWASIALRSRAVDIAVAGVVVAAAVPGKR